MTVFIHSVEPLTPGRRENEAGFTAKFPPSRIALHLTAGAVVHLVFLGALYHGPWTWAVLVGWRAPVAIMAQVWRLAVRGYDALEELIYGAQK